MINHKSEETKSFDGVTYLCKFGKRYEPYTRR